MKLRTIFVLMIICINILFNNTFHKGNKMKTEKPYNKRFNIRKKRTSLARDDYIYVNNFFKAR